MQFADKVLDSATVHAGYAGVLDKWFRVSVDVCGIPGRRGDSVASLRDGGIGACFVETAKHNYRVRYRLLLTPR
jgi:hypothetical protein